MKTNLVKECFNCYTIYFMINYIFKISSFSNVSSIFSNSSFNFASASISSTKLKNGLQPILMSLGQFLFTKINYLNYLIANDLLKLINVVIKKKSFQFQFVNQPMPKMMGKESNCKKHKFVFFSPLKMTFDIFCIHLKPLENQKFLANKLLY